MKGSKHEDGVAKGSTNNFGREIPLKAATSKIRQCTSGVEGIYRRLQSQHYTTSVGMLAN
jgi:hypothetical protein